MNFLLKFISGLAITLVLGVFIGPIPALAVVLSATVVWVLIDTQDRSMWK